MNAEKLGNSFHSFSRGPSCTCILVGLSLPRRPRGRQRQTVHSESRRAAMEGGKMLTTLGGHECRSGWVWQPPCRINQEGQWQRHAAHADCPGQVAGRAQLHWPGVPCSFGLTLPPLPRSTNSIFIVTMDFKLNEGRFAGRKGPLLCCILDGWVSPRV